MKICFLTKIDKPGVNEAISLVKSVSTEIDVFHGSINDPFPSKAEKINYDLLVSYISPWIVPKKVLDRTIKWNINFHPGPPEYPGIGCFNFAIYDSATDYGATAHIMEPKVDIGEIIGVERFPITNQENVITLSNKTYESLLKLFKKIMNYILENDSLPKSKESWKRKPFKRRELEALATINTNMSKQEINKRIRATYYPQKPAPFIELYGHKFEYNPDR